MSYFGRIVTVGISAHFQRVGRIFENPGETVEVRMVKFEVRNQRLAELRS
jgi:hypothetical protein